MTLARLRWTLALARLAIGGAGVFAIAASSASVQFSIEAKNAFGPLTEVGDTTVTVSWAPGATPSALFRCDSVSAQMQGQQVLFSAILDPIGPTETAVQQCQVEAIADVGPLGPGAYQVVATLILPGQQITTATSTFAIVARGVKCNVDPTANQLLLALANKTVDAFQSALANDATYRAALGNIAFVGTTSIFGATAGAVVAFPSLDDPVRVMDRLSKSGEFVRISRNSFACFPEPPPDSIGQAVEYYSPMLDHYFLTAFTNEQQALDGGSIPGNWVRTGKSFGVLRSPGCPIAREDGQHPIYRFTGEPNIGPNSHFFTASLDECGYVRDRADWHWAFEGVPFWASEPVGGGCPAGGQVLYRAYNNGQGGDPNHRYATDHAVIDAMVAQGWVDEGIAMCVLAGS